MTLFWITSIVADLLIGYGLTLSHFNKEKVNGRKNGKREDV